MARLPANEIPARADIAAVLNRSADLVLVLSSTWVYTSAVRFEIDVYKREPTVPLATYGFGRPERGSTFLLAFEWADDTISSNLPISELHGGLVHAGSHGGPQQAHITLRLDHLPPAGEFVIHSAWPYFDLAEDQVSFEAQRIIDAVEHVQTLWPQEVPSFTASDTAPTTVDGVLEAPTTGWFGRQFTAATQRSKTTDPEGTGFHVTPG
ncbi:hypothetical protein NWF34_11020 [Gordonia sp. GONU]|uniref:hypothetical protein n=1 Tax=Gordonia sp. GONU TaxID=2972949 RepID=UPI0021ABD744|nr:hypothetical protein [Gordonia sp. GONU]MCR8897478.1 hypothetical protein [Gordonia sp. GONU]